MHMNTQMHTHAYTPIQMQAHTDAEGFRYFSVPIDVITMDVTAERLGSILREVHNTMPLLATDTHCQLLQTGNFHRLNFHSSF